jgi:hypothetical protein
VNVYQPGSAKVSRKPGSVGVVPAAGNDGIAEDGPGPFPRGLARRHRHGAEVRVERGDPTAGLCGRGELAQYLEAAGQVHQQHPCVHQIECVLRQRVCQQIEAAHLDTIARSALEQGRLEINREHPPGRADPVSQHPRDRARTRPGIEAPPTGAHADRIQLPPGQRILNRLQQPQPKPLQLR